MRKLLIVLLVLTCMLGLTACLKFPQYLPSAEDAFYKLYPKDSVININEGYEELSLATVVVDKYNTEYKIEWKSNNEQLAKVEERDGVIFLLLYPTREQKIFTLNATIIGDDGDKVVCTATYNLYECIHTPGAAATCLTHQECTVCGKVLENARGHKYGAGPTCTEIQKCTVCQVKLEDALGHFYTDDGDCTTDVKCVRCDTIGLDGEADHVDEDIDGTCDRDNCEIVVGIKVDSNTSTYDINHNTTYHFENVVRISGLNIKVYTDATKTEEINLPYDLNGNESLYIENTSDDAILITGDRHTIPVCEFEIDKNREITTNSEGYITYFTGYNGRFALYFGEDDNYLGGDNFIVQIWDDVEGKFKDINNKLYTFDIQEDEIIKIKFSAKSGSAKIAFAVSPVPMEDIEYLLGINEAGENFYFNGKTVAGSASWFATSANVQDAIKVQVELVPSEDPDDVRYRLFYMNGTEKTYIRMYDISDGKRAGIELTTEVPDEYYVYNHDRRTLVYYAGNGDPYVMGSSPGDKIISVYEYDSENTVVHLYLA